MITRSGAESIVIIDDDPDILTVLSARLKHTGYQAATFSDSTEAIKHIRETPPDLVISDIKMPGLNGFEVCDLIRHNPRTEHIPIIMISGVDEARRQISTMRDGSVYCLSKPVEASDLIKVVKMALSQDFDL